MTRFAAVGFLVGTLAIGALVAQEALEDHPQPVREGPQILTISYWVADLSIIGDTPVDFEPAVLVAYLETLLKYEGENSELRIRWFDKTFALVVNTSQFNHQLIKVALQDLRDRITERKEAATDHAAEEALRQR